MTENPSQILRDIEAEKAHLGAMIGVLTAGYSIDGVSARLTGADYSNRMLGELHDITLSLVSEEKPVDAIILSDAIKEQVRKNPTSAWRKVSEVEIFEWLTLLAQSDSMKIEGYAQIVAEKSERKKAYNLGQKIAGYALNPNGTDPLAKAGELTESAIDNFVTDELTFWTASEIRDLRDTGALPETPVIIEGAIPAEGNTLLGGDTSGGKTFAAIDIAIGVATGEDVWGRKVILPGPVIFFGKDTPQKMLFNRMLDLCEGRDIIPPENLHFAWGDLDDDLNLNDQGHLLQLQRKIQKLEPVLVVIDDLSTYAPGVDLNSASDIGKVMVNLRKLSNRTGTAFLVLTLLNKGNAGSIGQLLYRIGGSVHIPGKVDTAFVITRTGHGADTVRTLHSVKSRLEEEINSQTFTIQDSPTGGLVLAYEKADSLSHDNTLIEFSATAIIEILKEYPSRTWKRKELTQLARDRGLKASDKTIKKAWPSVEGNQNVDRTQVGRAYVYQYRIDHRE